MNQEILKPSVVGNLRFQPCCQYTSLLENPEREQCVNNKKKNRIYLCVVVSLAVCVLALCCVCIPWIAYTLSAVRTMEARLITLEEKLSVVTSKYESLILQQQQQQQKKEQQQPAISHQSSTRKQTLQTLRRRRRNATRHTTINYVHLVGKGPDDDTTTVGDMTVFKWQKSELRQPHGLTLLPNRQEITSIKIVNAGVYLVYSQAVIHGHTDLTNHYECSHKTVLKKASGQTSDILNSLLTQDGRGQEYHDRGSAEHRPLDTQLQMGVFYLSADDELLVRIPQPCQSTNYSMSAESSYFGVVKIG